MSSIGAEVYVDGVRFGGTYFEDGRRLADRVHRSSLSAGPVADARTCRHEDTAVGYAYVDLYDWRWPVMVCRTCRSILKGRHPKIEERGRPAWKMEPDDVLVAQWNTRWPQYGRPRGKRPPQVAWPDAA